MDKSGVGAGFLRVFVFPANMFIPANSPSSQSPEAGRIGHEWLQFRVEPEWTPSTNIQIIKKGRWGRFSPSTSISPANFYSTKFSILTITRGRYNRPEVADVRVDPVWTPLPTTQFKKYIITTDCLNLISLYRLDINISKSKSCPATI
jgi:hypothetical protein